MSRDIFTKNWGTEKISLVNPLLINHLLQGQLKELHLKEDGEVNNGPSFCIVITSRVNGSGMFGQVSFKMLKEAFNELGYDLIKK